MRLTICDDMEIYSDLLKEMLQKYWPKTKEPLEIDSFSSGEEVLANYENDKYDAAILDVQMEGITGYETAYEILKQDPTMVIAFHTSHTHINTGSYEIEYSAHIPKGGSDSQYHHEFEKVYKDACARNLVFQSSVGDFKYKEIKYFRQNWRKLMIYTTKGEFVIDGHIRNLNNMTKFIKTSKKYYVNKMFIKDFKMNLVFLKDGSKLPLEVDLSYLNKIQRF
ncbi:MAG: response regulator [Oscillospiraceae bacterium]|nr:response regulator [Oscillospiraceae bacterium]